MSEFKQLIHRYKEGSATEEEIAIVDAAIEKNIAINDYLAEVIENDILEELANDQEADLSVNHIHKKVNSRLRKNMTISVLVVIIIFLICKYGVSPLVDYLYYDPTTISYGQYQRDISYDMAAFTELNVAGYISHRPIVTSKGYGAYDLTFRRSNLFKGVDYITLGDRIEIQLIRGKRLGYFDYLYGNDIYVKDKEALTEVARYFYEEPLTDLKEMHQTNYGSVFVQLNESLDLPEMVRLMDRETDVDFKWLAVRNTDTLEGRPIGFNPSISDAYSVDEAFDREKYPYFDLGDYYDDINKVQTQEEHFDSMTKLFDKHFRSLVQYLNDREEFVKVFGYNSLHYDQYQETLDYINEHGIKVYGVLLYGNMNDLTRFIENNEILTIQILDVKTSKYSN